MMRMEGPLTPDEYREQAGRLRAQADTMTVPGLREELLKIAAAFELLADRKPYPMR